MDVPTASVMANSDSCCPDWAQQLKSIGQHYYGGVVDDAESLLELHSRSTLSTFGTRTSVSKLSKQVQVDDENRSPIVTNVSNEVSIQLKSFKN